MNTTNGKIAEQSKLKLTEALFSVMHQYDFKEITVTQITQEAGLSRKTFYRLFSDKEGVISAFFEKHFQEFLENIKAKNIHNYWEVVQLYFDYWEEKKFLLSLLKKNNLLTLLFENSYKTSFEIFEFVHSKEVMTALLPLLPYTLSYAIGGMQSMLIKWVENDMVIPSTVLIEHLKVCFKSI